jgi:hypothetical protein
VLHNVDGAPGPDIVVILQRTVPGTYEVIFVQAKHCRTEATAKTNTSKDAILNELDKGLVSKAEAGRTDEVPKWRMREKDHAIVKPYFVFVQRHATDRNTQAPALGELSTLDAALSGNVAEASDSIQGFETSGAWFLSATGESLLFPASANSTNNANARLGLCSFWEIISQPVQTGATAAIAAEGGTCLLKATRSESDLSMPPAGAAADDEA